MRSVILLTQCRHSFSSLSRWIPVYSRPMNVNLGIWDKLTKLVIFLLFLAGIGVVFFWYLPLIQQNQRYRKEILALDSQISEQEKVSRYLRSSIDLHQNDPKTIERLSREKLGWAKTNEMVVRFEQPVRR